MSTPMEKLSSVVPRARVYSTINNNLNNSTVNKNIKLQYSTVDTTTVLDNLTDLINETYTPFYATKLRELGYERFMWLAGRARAGSDTPKKLFSWMLTHPELVK